MIQPGQQLGRYEILRELGRGAMGAVYQARDPKIDRVVAIKTIVMGGSDPEEVEQSRQRFFREAQAAGKLSAPGIVTIHDVGEDEASGTPFIVMEYVAGKTLDNFVQESSGGRITVEAACDLIRQIAEALDYAHQHTIVHRDIKPSNIIITEQGRAKIADFGIARVTVSEITLPGKVLGTPAYMSPEQLNGGTIDGRSDLFSLGVIAYWLLTGDKPFAGDSVTSVSFQVVYKDPAAAHTLNPAVSPELERILTRALAKDPKDRYQRGLDFANDIEDFQAGRTLRSEQPSPVPEQTVAIDATVAIQPPKPSRWKTALVAIGRFLRPPAVFAGRLIAKAAKGIGRLLLRFLSWIIPRPVANAARSFARGVVACLRHLRRHRILYSALVLLCLAGAGVLVWLSIPRSTLQITGQHPFRSAEITIWIDDHAEYRGQLRGFPHRHVTHSKTNYSTEGYVVLSLPVRTGLHTVRVNVHVPGEPFDVTKTITGQFAANQERKLHLDISESDFSLGWE